MRNAHLENLERDVDTLKDILLDGGLLEKGFGFRNSRNVVGTVAIKYKSQVMIDVISDRHNMLKVLQTIVDHLDLTFECDGSRKSGLKITKEKQNES